MEKLKQLKNHPFAPFLLFGVIIAILPLFSGILSNSFIDAFAKTLIFYIVALGFSFLIGYGGLASLGTSAFIAIGTFVLYVVMELYSLPFILAIIIGIAIAILVGVIFGFVSLRIEGMYLAIVTLGISEIATEVFKNLDKFTGGVTGRTFAGIKLFGQALSSNQVYFLIVVFVILAMILTYNLFNSPIGRSLLSVKNSDSAARAMGISVLKIRLIAFIVSSVYAVLAGLLYMGYVKFSMASYWSLSISLNILAAVVVGGSKSIWGTFVGTFIIFGLDLVLFKPLLSGTSFADFSFIISGVLIIIMMMYFPAGISGLFNKVIFNIKKKRAEKKMLLMEDDIDEIN